MKKKFKQHVSAKTARRSKIVAKNPPKPRRYGPMTSAGTGRLYVPSLFPFRVRFNQTPPSPIPLIVPVRDRCVLAAFLFNGFFFFCLFFSFFILRFHSVVKLIVQIQVIMNVGEFVDDWKSILNVKLKYNNLIYLKKTNFIYSIK